ncbi:MAG TPA: glycosyltransferase family 4 protein [Chitinophagaceae bacterium]|nr:glycosyltransferase family 4 protein [Chitinophagaceae bacterium]
MPKLIRITTAPLSLKYLLFNQMRYMNEHGFDVIMVSSEGKEWPDLIANEKCQHRIIPMTRKMTPFKDLASLWKLYRLFKKERPDIIHSHTPKAGLLAMLAARMAGIKPRIHTIAGLRFMTATGTTRRILVSMEKLTAKAATHVWPNSHSLLNYIQENKLVSDKKLEVIGHGSSNGVDLNRFSSAALRPEKLERIKQQIKYDPSCRYLLNMGRIVKDKGVAEVLESFKIVYEKDKQLRLVVLGAFEDDLDPISDEAREILKNHPAIIHIDWSDEVEYFMHLSHLLVHASYREGFPNTLLQSGAMNCPIVCSAIEGSIDIVTDKQTGLLFEPRNQKDLLEKLEYALAHPAEMKVLADALRQKVTDYFSQAYLHECLRKKYIELLDKKNKS